MQIYEISNAQASHFVERGEGHFVDNKARLIAPKKLGKHLSAFANADGGELLVGIAERTNGTFEWDGFDSPEDANGHIQHLETTFPYGGDFEYEFLEAPGMHGFVLRIVVFKTRDIRADADEKVYVRRGAQSLPVTDPRALARLERAKGLSSHEDQTLKADVADVADPYAITEFMLEIVPDADPVKWLTKQRMIVDSLPTVAGIVLFSDEPQTAVPKANVKVYRYKTADDEGTRETLVFDPITIEGSLYPQIADAVERTVRITEEIQKMTDAGLRKISYPREALHEVITNAVLHRDYGHNDDVHVRIFDNRIEVESPGRLPAHITPANILSERFARNPTMVRIINKFPNPPNKDVGEGLNTAFAAMEKLRLKEPEIVERDNSVLVVIRHESLASPEQQIVEYLGVNETINNSKAREITGVATDHQIRRAFKRLVAAGEIEQEPGTDRRTTRYRLPNA